ncbi:MAG: cyanophycinase [Bdellovibrionales bacterium RIFCSPHIGHO2_01_FULL_40_29]|nr:MAG: cyanophycinase [Bdellovibrionales bacterium RIFCSPHIGHO2_01_FULL_40_29]OFZ32413.1 MAG: cyanophycinase [Bdellovibrionales bacterium RIFCSPHIGHO2_02_FULL_40_15]
MTNSKYKRIRKVARKKKGPGSLIIIGGAEDKEHMRIILREVAQRSSQGSLVIVTAASEVPLDHWRDYRRIFSDLGVKRIEHLLIQDQNDGHSLEKILILKEARTVFFTGGDQLRITTKLGGTPVMDCIFEIYEAGGTIAGTSAGASMMGETMLMGGGSSGVESHKVGNWMMAPGLGLVENMVIDQHFAQRGRIGRLIRAVALNPGVLGIGVDEDTAIIIEESNFRVVGSNAVYVIDGHHVSYTNIAEASADKAMSIHDVRLHILIENEVFDLKTRKIETS